VLVVSLVLSFDWVFAGSGAWPHPIKEKLAKKEIAINNTTSFFIYFHLLSLFR
jgi:hypothetical protein